MTENPHYRFSYLDSSRGIAALIVLLSHFQLAILPEFSQSAWFQTPVRIFFDAEAAVLYFFILSGYVLTSSIQKTLKLNINDYFRFILKRVFRIYPAFIIAFILMFFTLLYIGNISNDWLRRFWASPSLDLLSLLKQLILVKRIPNEPELRLLPHDWTLSIEMAVSLLLPLLALIARIQPLVMLFIVYCSVKFLSLDPFTFDFSLGVYIASAQSRLKLKPGWIVLSSILGVVLICGGYFFSDFESLDHILIHHQSAGLALLLIVILSSGRIQKLLSLRPLDWLGKISYSFYLFHMVILLIMTQLFTTINSALFLLILIAGTTILSALNYFFIEKPYIRLGRKLSKQSPN